MARPTLVLRKEKALEAIKKGVDAIALPVAATFGPEAGTTLMYRTYNRGPRCVDDGYYTSESIVPKDPFVQLASEFYKEGIKRTNEKVGDGTSGTSIVAHALFTEVYNKIRPKIHGFIAGKHITHSTGAMRKDILARAEEIKKEIRVVAKPIKELKDLEKIASISLGEDSELSKLVAHLAFEVGSEGFIDVVEGYKGEVEVERVSGFRFPAKIADKAFVNKKERFEMVVEDTAIFCTNYKLDNDVLVQFILEKIGQSKVVIIAPDFSTLVLTKMALSFKAGMFIYPVKIPSLRTEQLEDLAVFCGAIVVDKTKGMRLENITGKEVGSCAKLIVKDVETREDAIILGGKGEKSEELKKRKEILHGQLVETKEPQYKKLMERRIASLVSGGGIIRVGAPTEAESLPLKLKVEDCVFACRAALKSGYVKGGGVCLKDISDALPEGHILKGALIAPYNQLQKNAGGVLKITKDIIDPADAIYYAVEHATSVVSSLITVETMVVEEPEIQAGQGEMEIAKAINAYVAVIKREKGIMTENEQIQEQDARGGMTEDEYVQTMI